VTHRLRSGNRCPDRTDTWGLVVMADVIYVAVTVGVFGALAIVARGVMKL
jgi:hypothetical protein